jgi:uncharacterized protein YcfL
MNRGMKTLLLMTVSVTLLGGCSSKESTHAYKLQNPQTDTALINSVLEGLWREHSIPSHSAVNEDGYAVVRTTNKAHAKIKRLLKEVQKPGNIQQSQSQEKGAGFRIQ